VQATAYAAEISAQISQLATMTTADIRHLRSTASKQLRCAPGAHVLEVADHLVDDHRWVAYELVYHHPEALSLIDEPTAMRLGRELSDWGAVDAYCRYISGPAWRQQQLDDDLIISWAASPDRWWRRAALVSTVPLNLRAAGGTGDTERTLKVCQLLVGDRDDMVVKALSWALRELVLWDSAGVRNFLDQHDGTVSTRVQREVTNKLETGLKDPR
jgi:3-methyladenine DNA glycosylase AlkD